LPSWLKIPLYRHLFRYQIGRGVRIGLSPLVGVRRCQIGDHTRIGHFNLFYCIGQLEIGSQVRIGFLNLFRGGDRLTLGDYVTILRRNVFNSILEPDMLQPVEPVLDFGPGVFVASGHWLDFTDRITVGAHTIIGGRNSSFWTHNRQLGHGIRLGCHCYLGSEVRAAPGVDLPSFCIVALGSVLMGRIGGERSLIGGNPAGVLRPLQPRDLILFARKTRTDIPDAVAQAFLPEDLARLVNPSKANPFAEE
jgi:acetyltransferase-like isoleucine patch superfamily enzyme